MSARRNYKKLLLLIVISSFVIRAVLAFTLELTNDEVNYWLYALYPSLSHFDHPPMVGYFIQLTTINLRLDSEFFLRLSSVVLGSVNTWIMYLLGVKVKDEKTGFYASLFYTASLYFFVITGVFIQPDTPLVFFWLMAMYFLLNSLTQTEIDRKAKRNLFLAGLAVGLGMLSKYHAAYLWAAAAAYIVFFKRGWLKTKVLYFSILISIICFIPVIVWNVQNDFISFTFQGERIDVLKSGLKFNYFLTELFGQIFYNNPVNFVVILLVLFKLKKSNFINKDKMRFLVLAGLPLALAFLFFSLFRRTLPHWSGPAYGSLILVSSAYLSDIYINKKRLVPASIKLSLAFLLFIIVFGVAQINCGLVDFSENESSAPTSLGRNDVTLDMYGWKQAGEIFKIYNKEEILEGKMEINAPILAYKWYNAGHIDYYFARPIGKEVIALGRLDEIRNYEWVNKKRIRLDEVKEAYYISPSRDFMDPSEVCGKLFRIIEPDDTIRIERNNKTAENIFIYKLKR